MPYGADAYKSDIVPFAWGQVSQGSAVYSMPGDIGPMAFYYDTSLLSKYHITLPTTWAQFATDAAALHKADPSGYLANFDPVETQWLYALMQEAGVFPFKYSGGTNVTIDFTGPAQMAFANYWQSLISAGDINHTSDFSPIFWKNLDSGVDASWLNAAWSPADMAPNLNKTSGDWRAAALPQESASSDVAGSWGGSTFAVVKGTKYPKQAAEFAEWYGGSMASWKILSSPAAGAFPGYTPLLNSSSLSQRHDPALRHLQAEPGLLKHGRARRVHPVAAVHDRSADRRSVSVRGRAQRHRDRPPGLPGLPVRPRELRPGAGLHR